MKRSVQAFWLLALWALAPAGTILAGGDSAGGGAANPPSQVLRLKTGDVDTSTAVSLRELVAQAAGQPGRFVLQLTRPIDRAARAELAAAGVVLGEYVPDHAFIVQLEHADAAALDALEFVRWIGPFRDEWKLDPQLGRREFVTPERAALQTSGRASIVITLFPGEDPAPVLGVLSELNAPLAGAACTGRHWLLVSELPLSDLALLAALPPVQFIEDAPEGVFRNDSNSWILQSNQQDVRPVWDAGIHGEGQIAGLLDGTLRQDHCMFEDSNSIGPDHRKLVAMRNAGPVDSHGTHTAGTLAGDYGTWGEPDKYDGMAFAAKISFADVRKVFSDPSTLYPRLLDAYNDGARVHSNSWGDDSTTAYTTWCRQADEFNWDHEDSLIVFSVSNKTTIKTPENAKNILAVAGCKDAPAQDEHGSGGTGPTKDGRRKPEVNAPSRGTISADSTTSCGFKSWSGTSMAAPAVSGAGVLVRQYFTDGYYPSGTLRPADAITPSGALLKATLINASVDMTAVDGYPSDIEGWGRVLLDNALYFDGDLSGLVVQDVPNSAGLATGENRRFAFALRSNAAPLHITLVYTEPPATVNADDPVINNLDLVVTDPDNATYLGNVFSSGESSTGGTADARNNVEQVLRHQPTAGLYLVKIAGTAVQQDTQGFAIAITGDTAPPVYPLGDLNCSGAVDFDDIDAFVLALTSQDNYRSSFPDCDLRLGDINDDGSTDFADIDGFVELLTH